VKTGDLSHPECEKVTWFYVGFAHRRSPPVSILGMSGSEKPVSGMCTVLNMREEVSTMRGMITVAHNPVTGPMGGGITDINPHIPHKGDG